jgi:hypothetical protein
LPAGALAVERFPMRAPRRLLVLVLVPCFSPLASATTDGPTIGDVSAGSGCSGSGSMSLTGVYWNPNADVYVLAGGEDTCSPSGTSSGIVVDVLLASHPYGAWWTSGTTGCVIATHVTGIQDRRVPCPLGLAPPDPGWGHLLP